MESLDPSFFHEYVKSDKFLFLCETFAKFFANFSQIMKNCILVCFCFLSINVWIYIFFSYIDLFMSKSSIDLDKRVQTFIYSIVTRLNRFAFALKLAYQWQNDLYIIFFNILILELSCLNAFSNVILEYFLEYLPRSYSSYYCFYISQFSRLHIVYRFDY